MILTPRAVLALIIGAGFTVNERGTALALVLACSGGETLYRDVSWPGPSIDARGLFGLDVVAHPQLHDYDLFDPAQNAKAARRLSLAADGSWQWAGCPVPSTSSEAFSDAKAAVRAGPKAQTLAESNATARLTGAPLQVARDLAGISDYVRSRILTEGGY